MCWLLYNCIYTCTCTLYNSNMYVFSSQCTHVGSMTPTSKSPSSAAVTPVNIFGNDELADILRASPGIDLSKLQIKQEPVSMLENEQWFRSLVLFSMVVMFVLCSLSCFPLPLITISVPLFSPPPLSRALSFAPINYLSHTDLFAWSLLVLQ